MLVLLPLLVFFISFLSLAALQEGGQPGSRGWRIAFLQAAIFCGVAIGLSSEVLSLLKWLTQAGVAVTWLVILLVLVLAGWRKGLLVKGWRSFTSSLMVFGRFEILVIAAFGLILAVLFVVAVVSPPNNTDSMQYHMSRVVNWAQDRSLQNYPTGYTPQLVNPIWAELAILNLRLLWGSDQLSSLVQWAFLLGSLIGASLIASLLGAGRRGQLLAAAFSFSVPMAILQATSTQNDLVVTFWLVCVAAFAILASQRELTRLELASLGAALGIGMLTKGTFYPFAAPLVAWFCFSRFIKQKLSRVLMNGALLVGIVVILNLGYWARNTLTFGGPLGSKEWVASNTASSYGVMPLLGSLTRNAMMNFITPSDRLNTRMANWLRDTFGKEDPSFKGFKFLWGWNHEDRAGSPLQVVLALGSFLLYIGLYRTFRNRTLLVYILAVLGMFVMAALLIMPSIYGNRYQLAFWVAWSPVFGLVITKSSLQKLAPAITIFLLLFTLPWVLFNRTAARNCRGRWPASSWYSIGLAFWQQCWQRVPRAGDFDPFCQLD